jgi:hypothetical protein
MKIALCESCGRVILRGFIYCPYCGVALHAGPAMGPATDSSFRRLEAMQTQARAEHIDELLERLDGLEADVEEILNGIGLPG